MNNHFSLDHIGQIVEITYTEPGWGNPMRMVGRLEGFHDSGTTIEWWMAGRTAKASISTCAIRTMQQATDSWMQPTANPSIAKEDA